MTAPQTDEDPSADDPPRRRWVPTDADDEIAAWERFRDEELSKPRRRPGR